MTNDHSYRFLGQSQAYSTQRLPQMLLRQLFIQKTEAPGLHPWTLLRLADRRSDIWQPRIIAVLVRILLQT